MESYKNILKATSLFGGVHGLTIVLNLIRTKIAAELLGPAGTGLNSIYNETRELIHSTTNLGLDASGIRNISKSYESWRNAKTKEEKAICQTEMLSEISLLRSWVILLATLGTFLCMLLAEPLSFFTFDDLNHTWGYVLLSPAIGFSTMVCGELTILKATRRIKLVAFISVMFVLLGILISLPLYYYLGIDGVLPALIVLFAAETLFIISFSYRRYKPVFCFQRDSLKKGLPILKLGIAFALSGMFTHGTQLAIRSFFNQLGGLEMVGLYGAGYSMMIYVSGIAFASLDSDYFPRLAGIFNNLAERRATVNRQIKVTGLLSLVSVAVCIPLLPYIIPILTTDEFLPVVPMTQIAMVSLVFRAIYLPYSFLNLAAGASKLFLVLELTSNIIILLCVLPGYYYGGLTGAGFGLLVAQIIDTIISFIVAKVKYGL